VAADSRQAEAPAPLNDQKAEELRAIIQDIKDRVRARYPGAHAGSQLAIPLPDLQPIVRARDAAEGKVASIGTVNPRPPGLANSLVQSAKRSIARSLNWFVRDQVDFNRALLYCVDTLVEALNESNRTIVRLDEGMKQASADSVALRQDAAELKDIRSHWVRWREDWEQKLFKNEVQFLRSVADLQAGFQHRALLMEGNFRETAKGQHAEFKAALDLGMLDAQRRLWADLDGSWEQLAVAPPSPRVLRARHGARGAALMTLLLTGTRFRDGMLVEHPARRATRARTRAS